MNQEQENESPDEPTLGDEGMGQPSEPDDDEAGEAYRDDGTTASDSEDDAANGAL